MRTLNDLLQVVSYADNHRVKNVRFRMETVSTITYQSKINLYNHIRRWADKHRIITVGLFSENKQPNIIKGVVLQTPRRGTLVIVYF